MGGQSRLHGWQNGKLLIPRWGGCQRRSLEGIQSSHTTALPQVPFCPSLLQSCRGTSRRPGASSGFLSGQACQPARLFRGLTSSIGLQKNRPPSVHPSALLLPWSSYRIVCCVASPRSLRVVVVVVAVVPPCVPLCTTPDAIRERQLRTRIRPYLHMRVPMTRRPPSRHP